MDRKSTDKLLSERYTVYKYLLRCQEVPGCIVSSGSAFRKLFGFLNENERLLIGQSVDVSKLKYSFDSNRLLLSSFVGLFWFEDDYNGVTDIIGVNEFSSGDVSAMADIYPEGFHNDFSSNTSEFPRGRVSLIKGTVVINVGLKCPDSAIDYVIKAFGLGSYRESLHVNKGYHWDPK